MNARVILLHHPGDSHHEKLIQVGAVDGQKLQPLQQGVVGVAGLLEYAGVKFNPAEGQHFRGGIQFHGARAQ